MTGQIDWSCENSNVNRVQGKVPRRTRSSRPHWRADHDLEARPTGGATRTTGPLGRRLSSGRDHWNGSDQRRHHRATFATRSLGGRERRSVIALLDTHVLVQWISGSDALSETHRRVIKKADTKSPLWVSDISLWEIATLYSLGRIELDLPLRDWLERATAPPLVRRVGILPAIAAEVAALPDDFHRDPADRIIVSTARVMGATLLTRDQRIRDAGLVAVL